MSDSVRVPVDRLSPRATWLRHMSARVALRNVLSAFAAARIVALPVKGIVTAHTLYDDVAARPLGDIDLRIRPRDFGRAVRVATALGFAPVTGGPLLYEAVLRVDGWEVDIAGTFGPPGLCAISVDAVIRRATQRIEPLGFAHLEADLNDHALILALNAFKDGLRPMPWALEDLHRIARHPLFDRDVLVWRAHEGKIASALWIVSNWLSEAGDSGAAPWRAVRDRLGKRPKSRRVQATYDYVHRRGWNQKQGLVVTASASDSAQRSVAALALLLAGLARRRAMIATRARGS